MEAILGRTVKMFGVKCGTRASRSPICADPPLLWRPRYLKVGAIVASVYLAHHHPGNKASDHNTQRERPFAMVLNAVTLSPSTAVVFNGPPPTIHSLTSEDEEIDIVGNWIAEGAKAGMLPHEFGVFVRSR